MVPLGFDLNHSDQGFKVALLLLFLRESWEEEISHLAEGEVKETKRERNASFYFCHVVFCDWIRHVSFIFGFEAGDWLLIRHGYELAGRRQ